MTLAAARARGPGNDAVSPDQVHRIYLSLMAGTVPDRYSRGLLAYVRRTRGPAMVMSPVLRRLLARRAGQGIAPRGSWSNAGEQGELRQERQWRPSSGIPGGTSRPGPATRCGAGRRCVVARYAGG